MFTVLVAVSYFISPGFLNNPPPSIEPHLIFYSTKFIGIDCTRRSAKQPSVFDVLLHQVPCKVVFAVQLVTRHATFAPRHVAETHGRTGADARV